MKKLFTNTNMFLMLCIAGLCFAIYCHQHPKPFLPPVKPDSTKVDTLTLDRDSIDLVADSALIEAKEMGDGEPSTDSLVVLEGNRSHIDTLATIINGKWYYLKITTRNNEVINITEVK